ncbi:MAG: hypothetical protein U5L09_10310 [Bacteroidales bacterium]|nr:hypothetical protein [Bacteroidales bacterium]
MLSEISYGLLHSFGGGESVLAVNSAIRIASGSPCHKEAVFTLFDVSFGKVQDFFVHQLHGRRVMAEGCRLPVKASLSV